VERFGDRVYRLAMRITGSNEDAEEAGEEWAGGGGRTSSVFQGGVSVRAGANEDAEEAAQDALWTAARKIQMFKGESAFGSWIYRITANAAYQKLRTRRQKSGALAIHDLTRALAAAR